MKRAASFKWKIFLVVLTVLLVQFALVFVLQTLFVEIYYFDSKQQDLDDAFKQMSASMTDSATLSRTLQELENSSISFNIWDAATGAEVYNSRGHVFSSSGIAKFPSISIQREVSVFSLLSAEERVTVFSEILSGQSSVRLNSGQTDGFRRTQDVSNIQLLGTAGGFYLLLDTPIQPIEEAAAMATQFSLFAGMVALVLGALSVFVVSGVLTRRIRQVTGVAGSIAHLDFSQQCDTEPLDEVGLLGESINTMSRNLQSYTQQLEEDVERRRQMIEAQKNLLSNISHELKTPLALISGYAEGLKSGMADTDQSRGEYCSIILDESRRMTGLIYQLLRLSRLQSGYQKFEPLDFALDELLDGLLLKFQLSFTEADITVERGYPSPLPVYADFAALEQVVQNFLQNAQRYTPKGGRVHISAWRMEEGGVALSVRNDGPHIEEADLPLIWDSFYRGDKARSRGGGETGLGLSIVRAHVERHGGHYGAENVEGGVRFWITLPDAQPDDTTIEAE